MNRRGFLASCLALAAAPAIVRASSLMPVRVLDGDWIKVGYEAINSRAMASALIGPAQYIALFTSDAGARWDGEVFTGREYARVALPDLVLDPAGGKFLTNDREIAFPMSTQPGIVHEARIASGERTIILPLSVAKHLSPGDQFSFRPGGIKVSHS